MDLLFKKGDLIQYSGRPYQNWPLYGIVYWSNGATLRVLWSPIPDWCTLDHHLSEMVHVTDVQLAKIADDLVQE